MSVRANASAKPASAASVRTASAGSLNTRQPCDSSVWRCAGVSRVLSASGRSGKSCLSLTTRDSISGQISLEAPAAAMNPIQLP